MLNSNHIEKPRYTSGQLLPDMYTYISRFFWVQFDIRQYTQPPDTRHSGFIVHNLIQTSTSGQDRYSWMSHFNNPDTNQVQGLCHLGFAKPTMQLSVWALHFRNISLLSLSAQCTRTTHTSILGCFIFLSAFLFSHFYCFQELSFCDNAKNGIVLQQHTIFFTNFFEYTMQFCLLIVFECI